MKAGFCLITLLSCLVLFSPVCHAAPVEPAPRSTIEGLVVGISEGDRITVNSFGTEIQVRLYGIAAPQIAKIDKLTGWTKAGQPYAEEAFRALSVKILHQNVKVEIRRTIVYKNEVATQVALAVVYLDGRNINLEMAADGWAWANRKQGGVADLHPYLVAERRARLRRLGLWSQDNPQPPWDFHPRVIMPKPRGPAGQ